MTSDYKKSVRNEAWHVAQKKFVLILQFSVPSSYLLRCHPQRHTPTMLCERKFIKTCFWPTRLFTDIPGPSGEGSWHHNTLQSSSCKNKTSYSPNPQKQQRQNSRDGYRCFEASNRFKASKPARRATTTTEADLGRQVQGGQGALRPPRSWSQYEVTFLHLKKIKLLMVSYLHS